MTIALSFFVESHEQAAQQARAAVGLADLVELRLDRAPRMDFEALVRAMPLPVIATCMREADGGHWSGGEDERSARLLAAARGGARYVDVPLGLPRPEGLPASTHVVHSWHEKEGEQADLRLQLHHIERRLEPGDVAKVVSWAEDHAEAMRVMALYGSTRAPLVAFAQGPGGGVTRAWAPVFGAPWVYARGEGAPGGTAPGQWSVRDLFALYPPGGPSRDTVLYGVVGNPVTHSRSPLLWNTALRMAQLDAFYVPIEVRSFDRFLHRHEHPGIQGFSITAPFKRDALQAASSADVRARAIGAANTLHREPGGWKAYSTDGPAALDALEAAGFEGGPVLVLGAGGAARCAVHEAALRGHPVHVAARRLERAAELAAALEPELPGPVDLSASALEELHGELAPSEWAAVIQATPVGSEAKPGNLLAGRRLEPSTVVLDMIYAPRRTALLAQVEEQGAVGVPGYQMLVRQMLAQFRIFTGREIPPEPLFRTVEADLAATAP